MDDSHNNITVQSTETQLNINNGSGQQIIYNNIKSELSFKEVSNDLRSWHKFIFKDRHIDRQETTRLIEWINNDAIIKRDDDKIALLVGDAGTGKSVVMRDVLEYLEEKDVITLGLKSDLLFENGGKLDENIGLDRPLTTIIQEHAAEHKVVLLIDQIDALSYTLTTNRAPLHSINTLVEEVKKNRNVRIILSCRRYDLQYDPAFERYRNNVVVSMEGLPKEEVEVVLKFARIIVPLDDTAVMSFLTNPLNLFLFCRVKVGGLFNGKRPNRTILYEELWNQVVNKTRKKYPVHLCSCLDGITSYMYENQSLSISNDYVNTRFPKEAAYLISNNFLLIDQNFRRIQFLHQSMFDYVYARLFLSQNKSISSILEGIHQGLYVRLRLKQILFYLRDVDEESYFKNLDELLFATDENGKSKYRFHLKHLMVSNIGYLQDLTDRDKTYIKKKILADVELREIYIDSIDKNVGLDLFIEYINEDGGFERQTEKRQLQLLNACERAMHDEQSHPIKYILGLNFDNFSEAVRNRLENLVNRLYPQKANLDLIEKLINRIDSYNDQTKVDLLLSHIIDLDPNYVAKRIIAIIKNKIEKLPWNVSPHSININYSIGFLLDKLKARNSEVAFETVYSIVECISRHGVPEQSSDSLIKPSFAYFLYQRKDKYGTFVDDQLTYLLDNADEMAAGKPDDFASKMDAFAKSDLASIVLIAVSAYTKNIEYYQTEAFELCKRILNSDISSSILSYYTKEMFRVMFPLINQSQKEELMKILEHLKPSWEREKNTSTQVQKTLNYIDYTRAQYYKLLPPEELSKYPEAKKVLQEKERLFNESLTNTLPFKTSMMTGWPTLPDEKYEDKNARQLAKLMCDIKEDDHLDWDKPTKTGNAFSIKNLIPKSADVVYEAYIIALNECKHLDLDYPLYGIDGFLDNRFDVKKINILVEKIIQRIEGNIDKTENSHIIQTIRLVSKYAEKRLEIPYNLFKFVCQMARDFDDSEYKDEFGAAMSYNDGINQVRGCAAEALLYGVRKPSYIDEIFDSLFAVATNGAISTKASVMLKLGILASVDLERCRDLFIKMTKGYPTTLLSMPIHSQNPLLYLINNYFDDLKDYFAACQQDVKAHSVNVVILWIAWLRGNEDAEKMMYEMADASIEGRCALLREISRQNIEYLENILPILYRYLDRDEQETGSCYDFVFQDIMKWGKDERIRFTDKFVQSRACSYCSHYFAEYLSEIATKEPENCLKWIPNIYRQKCDAEEWQFGKSKLIDLLITSYNCIKEYDKSNVILENAMEMLDEWLHDNLNRQHLFECFKLLDE